MYAITGHGITVGFHRYFTHKSFKPNAAVKIALAIAGSMAIQGPVVRWVADHRKHHKFSDRDGDPHSSLALRHHDARPRSRACSSRTWAGCSTPSRPRSGSTPPTC